MNLMKFELFNDVLDRFQSYCNNVPSYKEYEQQYQNEIIPYDLFVDYFSDESNHLTQISNKDSPMR